MRHLRRPALWLTAVLTGVACFAPAAASAVTAAAGTCKPVVFIGARGSGEPGTVKPAKKMYGMGKELDYMALQVYAAFMKKGVATAFMPVDYPADSVGDLKPNAAVLALLGLGDTTAALAAYKKTSVDKYDASMTEGIKQAEAAVTTVLSSCPDAEIIMGGYSQGAVAVHDAENWLVNNQPAEFRHIVGTLLLGDPDRVPNTKAKPFGDSATKAEGLRVYLHLVKAHDVPAPGTTANIANKGDIVGDFEGILSVLHYTADKNVHESYETTVSGRTLLASAANWVVGTIRPVITTTRLPVATAGQSYSAQLTTADHRLGTWKITVGKLPPGLSLSGHTISGAATTAGTYPFTLSFTDTGGLTATGHATLVVDHSSWKTAAVPLPANAVSPAQAGLWGVSCPSASFCTAVGTYEDATARSDGLLLTRSGGSWTAAQAPLPAGAAGATLNAVSCPSASFCAAAGYYLDASGGEDPLLLTGSGKSWTVAQAPLPADAVSPAYASLSAVSCASASFCTAVGHYADMSGGQDALLLTWSGGSWTGTRAPLPADSASPAGASLYAVSCPSASFCVAGGTYMAGDRASLLLTWSGGSWTAGQPFTGYQGEVNGLSCPSVSFCKAVGDYLAPNGLSWNYRPEVLTWSGSSWTEAAGPVPAGAIEVSLFGGSCASASYCVVVGNVNDGSNWQTMLLTWSGSAWTAAPSPYQPNLYSVSCPSAWNCVAVGGTAEGNPIMLSESG
jgi:hypothetical protein